MKKMLLTTVMSILSILCIGCTANFKTEPVVDSSIVDTTTKPATTTTRSTVTIVITSTYETSTETIEAVETTETTETTEAVTAVETTTTTVESSYVMETTPIVTTVAIAEVPTYVDAPYTVRSGDTIGEIAYANYLTPKQVMDYNGLTTDIIHPGQIIYLPGVSEYEVIYPEIYSNSSNDNSEYNPTPEYNSDGLVNWFSVTLSTTGAGYESWYNIELAASTLDGYVLPAGTTFSWASVMGPSDTYQGYLLAPGYVNDEVVYVPGGGICFVSTTLMQAARGAGCSIIEKHDHSLPVSYATPGNEASVNWGSWDLRFYNPSSTTDLVFHVTTDEWSRSCTITCSPLS